VDARGHPRRADAGSGGAGLSPLAPTAELSYRRRVRSRLLCAAIGVTALSACSSPPPASPAVVDVAAAPTAAVAALAEPEPALQPLDPSLPPGCSLTASAQVRDLEETIDVLLRALPPRAREGLAKELRGVESALDSGVAGLGLGLDPSRPMVLGLRGIAPETRPALERLREISGRATANGPPLADAFAAIDDASKTAADFAIALRVVLPVTSPSATLPALRALLERARFTPDRAPPGLDALLVSRNGRTVIAMASDGGHVVLDLFSGSLAPEGTPAVEVARRVAAARRSRAAGGPSDKPPALEGHTIRVTYSPTALAEIGFLSGVLAARGALAAVDPAVRDQIASAGLWEASRSFALAAGPRGAYVDRVDITLDRGPRGELAPVAEMRVDPGPGASEASSPTWAPSRGVELPGAFARLDLSRAFLLAWSFPPSGAPSTDTDLRAFRGMQREAGWPGIPVSPLPTVVGGLWHVLPDFIISNTRTLPFERFGMVTIADKKPDIFFGLMPEGADERAAACALAEGGKKPCPPAQQLKPNAITPISGGHARLVRVEKRFVVLYSRERAEIERVTPKLTAPIPPVQIDLPARAVLDDYRELRGLGSAIPPRYRVELSLDGKRELLRAGPVK
jgi:hypothetical protein